MTPEECLALQQQLNRLGWHPPLKEDGVYGPKTKAAESALLHNRPLTHVTEAFADLNLPWGDAIRLKRSGFYDGLEDDCFFGFKNVVPGEGPVYGALAWAGKADIDGDGVTGGDNGDPTHQSDTTLHWATGEPCNALMFFGFVLPPGVRKEFKIRIGDYGYVAYGGFRSFAQYFDAGPNDKIGEVSIALAKALGIPASPTRGGVSHGVSYIVFPGSGPGVAVGRSTQELGAASALAKVRGK